MLNLKKHLFVHSTMQRRGEGRRWTNPFDNLNRSSGGSHHGMAITKSFSHLGFYSDLAI